MTANKDNWLCRLKEVLRDAPVWARALIGLPLVPFVLALIPIWVPLALGYAIWCTLFED
jgi:hypothetical protein